MRFRSYPFRAVDEVLHELANGQPVPPAELPLDAFRRGGDVWIHVDLPGVPPESIDVTVIDDRLEIHASRQQPARPGDRLYAAERPVGPMTRTIRLGSQLDVDGLEADYHDGVLTLRIPVAASALPRRIPITPGRSAAIEVESTLVDPSDPAGHESH